MVAAAATSPAPATDRNSNAAAARLHFFEEVEALFGGRKCHVGLSGYQSGCAPVEEVQGKALGVAAEPRRLDCPVEQFLGLERPALDPKRCSQHRHDEREQAALTGCATEPERAFPVAMKSPLA